MFLEKPERENLLPEGAGACPAAAPAREAKDYILSIPQWTREKHSLDEVRLFLSRLAGPVGKTPAAGGVPAQAENSGDPFSGTKIIHVAGTNGKGSVCADLTAVLCAAGFHVGTFTSPHLTDVKERFLYDGEPVGDAAFAAGFSAARAAVGELMEEGHSHPAFFEFVFLMAAAIFGKLVPDFLVLETGMGGRLDATNAVRRPAVCVITSIGLDHTKYLGGTIAQIAGEKAGIIKPGVPVVFDAENGEAAAVIRRRAAQCGSPACAVTAGILDAQSSAAEAYHILQRVSFAAPYQRRDAALAVTALLVLEKTGALRAEIPRETIRIALARVQWPGRMEQIRPGVWLDGAHNPDGIRAFIEAVKAREPSLNSPPPAFPAGKVGPSAGEPGNRPSAGAPASLSLLFAAVDDKDYREMIRLLAEGLSPRRVGVVQLKSGRGTRARELAGLFSACGCPDVMVYPDAEGALAGMLRGRPADEPLYIVGSLYLIGEIRPLLEETGSKPAGGAARRRAAGGNAAV